jgi:DNA repair protein RadD
VWPSANVGIHSASVGKKDLHHDIIYATIGSIYKKAHLLGRIDLVLADECHLINSKEAGIWRSFLNEMKRYNQHMRTIGWTGTPFRGDGVWLTAGDEPLFHGVAAKVTMRELIDLGFLAPLVPGGVKMTMSAEGVSVVNGDYKISELAARVDKSELVEAACDEIVQLAADRKRWLVFCVTVEHATHVCEALKARDVVAEVVSAETPKAERERIINDFRTGRIRALCNVAVLTTGFDVPAVDCIALLRNTKSPVLYVQIAGRGMRVLGADIAESSRNGKSDCLWLDFTDTTSNLGPVDAIQGRGPKRKMTSEKPVKLCEECGSINAVSARECVDCGAPFEIVESDPHGIKVSNAAIMSGQRALTRYTVDRVTYAKHQKPGKPPSLRVEYWHGLRVVAKEWIAIESDSQYGRGRAVMWWSAREPRPMDFVPGTVDQAMDWIDGGFTLRQPTCVVVNESGKYPEIASFEWGQP